MASRSGQPSVAAPASGGGKSRELFGCTIRTPPYSYAHLEMTTEDGGEHESAVQLDALQVRSYCSAALRQFLGDTGAAVAVDVLQVRGTQCWLRVPRDDLAAFAAAITAFPGRADEDGGGNSGGLSVLRLRACGDWLGTLLGGAERQSLWRT